MYIYRYIYIYTYMELSKEPDIKWPNFFLKTNVILIVTCAAACFAVESFSISSVSPVYDCVYIFLV